MNENKALLIAAVTSLIGCARSQWYRDKPECQTADDCACPTVAICDVDHRCQCISSQPPPPLPGDAECQGQGDCDCPATGTQRGAILVDVTPDQGAYRVLVSPSGAIYATGVGDQVADRLPLGEYWVQAEHLFGWLDAPPNYVQLRADGEVVLAEMTWTQADMTATVEPIPYPDAMRGTEAVVFVLRLEATKYGSVESAMIRMYANTVPQWDSEWGDIPSSTLTDAVRLYEGDTMVADRRPLVESFHRENPDQFDAGSGDYCYPVFINVGFALEPGETRTLTVKVAFLGTLSQMYYFRADWLPCLGYGLQVDDGAGSYVAVNGQQGSCTTLVGDVIEVTP